MKMFFRKKKVGAREAVWDYIKFLEVDHRMSGMAGDLKEALKEGINIARMGAPACTVIW